MWNRRHKRKEIEKWGRLSETVSLSSARFPISGTVVSNGQAREWTAGSGGGQCSTICADFSSPPSDEFLWASSLRSSCRAQASSRHSLSTTAPRFLSCSLSWFTLPSSPFSFPLSSHFVSLSVMMIVVPPVSPVAQRVGHALCRGMSLHAVESTLT